MPPLPMGEAFEGTAGRRCGLTAPKSPGSNGDGGMIYGL